MPALLAPVLISLGMLAPSRTAQGTAATPSQGTAATPSQHTQTAELSQYRNDALHLVYSYPSNFVDASGMVSPALEASVGQDAAATMATKCLSIPFSRMAQVAGKVDLLLLLREDGGCSKHKLDAKSLMESTRGEAQGLAQTGAHPHFGEPVPYQLAGRSAAMLQGSFTLPTGQTLQAMVACVLLSPDIACWQFLSSATADLGTLASLPVSLDGAPAVPLVPASVLESR